MIERWLVAVRDHPERPPALQRHVLTCLGLRMDWVTGRGFASAEQLAADASAEERTVRRATAWARKEAGLLLCTRRGHRLGNGMVAASEWQLTLPVDKSSQPDTGDLLSPQPDKGATSTGQSGHLNRTAAHPHQESSPSASSSSRRSAIDMLRAADPAVTEDETREVIGILAARPAVRDPVAVLGAEIKSGNGYVLITQARHLLDRQQWQDGETAPALQPPAAPPCRHCHRSTRAGHLPGCPGIEAQP